MPPAAAVGVELERRFPGSAATLSFRAARTIDSPSSRRYRGLHDNPLGPTGGSARLPDRAGQPRVHDRQCGHAGAGSEGGDPLLSARDLTHMTQRADALGWVQVASASGCGTHLHGSLRVVAVGVRA